MKNNNNNNLDIFNKNVNNKYKLLPFNLIHNHVGITKYLPPVSKEWKNTIYFFNSNNIKNYPISDININNLIKGFFQSRFDNKYLLDKYIPNWKRYISMNKIYVSKPELKHTNSNTLITIHTYNKEKSSLLQKVKFLKKSLRLSLRKNLKHIYMLNHNKNLVNFFNDFSFFKKNNQILAFFFRKELFKDNIILSNDILSKRLKMKVLFFYYIILIRKYKLKLNLNKYKFEEKFLYKLSNLISKFYNKKVTFNIINMKSFVFHSDFFTRLLALKLKNRKIQLMKSINYILNKVSLPKINRLKEIGKKKRTVNFSLLENKYHNLNISYLLSNKKNIISLLKKIYYISFFKNKSKNDNTGLYNVIFNSIKYKNMAGIRLEAAGRLTKRYRADRALFKVKWKGGLKNIDSSYKGISSVNLRGHVNPNVNYSILSSKRRVGSFAVKGWLSGK
jgi:hypothetical protein